MLGQSGQSTNPGRIDEGARKERPPARFSAALSFRRPKIIPHSEAVTAPRRGCTSLLLLLQHKFSTAILVLQQATRQAELQILLRGACPTYLLASLVQSPTSPPFPAGLTRAGRPRPASLSSWVPATTVLPGLQGGIMVKT